MSDGQPIHPLDSGAKLTPFGTAGDEPLGCIEGAVMGVREAVWRGYVSREVGEKAYPQGDWSVLDAR